MPPPFPQLVEALSNRSKCQACGEFIAYGSIRVGMPARHNGVLITKWLHPECFARELWRFARSSFFFARA